jgi:hypothetical protein
MFNLNWVFFAIIHISFLSLHSTYAQPNCKLRKDEEGIKVYTCHVDTSRFKSIKAEFDITCSIEDLINSVTDVPGYTRWQFNTMQGKIVKSLSSHEKIYHTVIEAPWPVTDRDMVVHLRIVQSEKELVITTDSESNILPAYPSFVRVPFSHAQWTVISQTPNQLHVKYEMLIDPGGAVPAWLVNWTCANAPLQSFQKLKLLLEKK